MKLKQTPILRLYKLETNKEDHAKFVKAVQHNMLTSQENEPGTLFMQTSHDEETTHFLVGCYQDEASYFRTWIIYAVQAMGDLAVCNIILNLLRRF